MARLKVVAPSILGCDQACFGAEVKAVEKAGADWLHVDIMDGHFVPNISFGAGVVASIRPHSSLPFDCHLMVDPVCLYVDALLKAGVNRLTSQIETLAEGPEVFLNRMSKAKGVAVGLALKPDTKLEALAPYLGAIDQVIIMGVVPGFGGQKLLPNTGERVARVRQMLDAGAGAAAREVVIEVDGGVTNSNAASLWQAGADILVAGSAVFSSADYKSQIDAIRG